MVYRTALLLLASLTASSGASAQSPETLFRERERSAPPRSNSVLTSPQRAVRLEPTRQPQVRKRQPERANTQTATRSPHLSTRQAPRRPGTEPRRGPRNQQAPEQKLGESPPVPVAASGQLRSSKENPAQPPPSRVSPEPASPAALPTPTAAASENPPVAPAEDGLARLAGEWNSDASGENISIRRSALGWEAWISNLGLGSIAITARRGGNLEISTRDVTCLYFATFVSGGRMSWQLRDGPIERCPSGQFTPVVRPVGG
jgi:hypothetical protein